MRRPDDAGRLQDMLQSAQEAISLVQGRNRADLDNDRLFSLAVARLLEIIGEAAARLSPHFRERYPDIPWKAIISLRNRLIHAYSDLDYDVIWTILRDDLPKLMVDLKRITDDHAQRN